MLENPAYALTDAARIQDLVTRHSWVTLVSHLPTGLVVSHAPILTEGDAARLTVVGHLARADAETHELGRHDVVVIVQGPHGYVTPDWYVGGPYVPTWNFVVCHLHGRPELLSADETYDVLSRTVDHYEQARPTPFRLGEVTDYARQLAPHTTGFRLAPSRIDAKAKLSQDKPLADQAGVLRGLDADAVHGNPELAATMRSYGVGR
ncbi:FMN-binding negative transcriptional regulator [Kribbella turkmenica]|uniref:FMN-binding negative transcriptional regulator n=1 Tax=Kribbella turkmenica TaxID=2530375 RepID=A0A4R4WXZ3_9ACTN|nr:FMN-binding negative transcriptional regulator [Kribbella turkmenica]TDD22648.1 FMN-binding negative transcriptional regulator [Kribbella turkmenica]